jgi:iron(III) transport system permease protein
VALVVVPLAILLLSSFREGAPWAQGAFTLENYARAYGSAQTWTMLGNTVVIAVASTALSLVVAGVFAYLTERTDMPYRNVAWALMLLPLAVPGLLHGISWTLLLSPTIGMANGALRAALSLAGVVLEDGPLSIYGLGGLVFLEGLRGVTTVFLLLAGAFRAMDPSLEEAATVAGADRRRTTLRVFVPVLAPAFFAAGMYSFMSHLESLEIPLVVGLPAGIHVFSTYIFFSAQHTAPPQYGLSAALGATFLVASALFVVAYRRIGRRADAFAVITGRAYQPRIVRLGRWRYPAFAGFAVFFVLTIGAPGFALVWRSLLRFYVPPSAEALELVSLTNYATVLADRRLGDAALHTVVVAAGAATLTMALSLAVAWAVVRGRLRGGGVLDGITFAPHAIPGVIVGLALVYLWAQPPLSLLPVYGTVWIVVLGLTVGYVAYGSRTINAALLQLHRDLEEVAAVSGASRARVLARIVVPLLLPSLVAGWIWVSAHSLRAFSIPLLLSTRENVVVPVVLWDLWDQGRAGPATALGVMLVALFAVFAAAGRYVVVRVTPR